ncbi:efflux RND transporter periplasmic adaptor subunit [Shewanella sp. HL-SH5]|uniref:efflux RND transporter periplasmic adaptor subunit n=1 Tax=Shewanella sp. HL-SH5 TaxID=3436241 RepID=UPI003EBBA001
MNVRQMFCSFSSTSIMLLSLMVAPPSIASDSNDITIDTNSHSFARPVKVIQLDIGKGFRERLLPGEVRAADKASLSFRVAGQIADIYVRPGDHVKAGDLLAKLDSDLYQQQYEVAKAQYELAKVLFERSSSLVEQGVVSRNDFDQSKSDFTIARAALDKAETDLAYTQLKAPYDGMISKRDRKQFEFVQAQESIMGIRTESFIDISFQLPEQFIGAIQANRVNEGPVENIDVKFDSRDAWYKARLKELSTVADTSTGSYTIILTLKMPTELNVLPGMAASVRVKLPYRGASSNPVIAAGARVEENGQTYVFRWLPEQLKVEKVAVTLNDNQLESGLEDGDWLVVAGASELTDGESTVRWVKERGL